MLTDDRLQDLIAAKDTEAALATGKAEFWRIVDGALVIFDGDDLPPWVPTPEQLDDDGNTAWGRNPYAGHEHGDVVASASVPEG